MTDAECKKLGIDRQAKVTKKKIASNQNQMKNNWCQLTEVICSRSPTIVRGYEIVQSRSAK